jgi:hypothetical protein
MKSDEFIERSYYLATVYSIGMTQGPEPQVIRIAEEQMAAPLFATPACSSHLRHASCQAVL